MNILMFEYKHYGIEDIKEAFLDFGYNVNTITYKLSDNLKDIGFENILKKELGKIQYDFVFSFNFYPVISRVCEKQSIKYVSWVYDSPMISLYSYTVINKCNYIFIFDSEECKKLKSMGINNVYYLPLAVNVNRVDKTINNKKNAHDIVFESENISFVGSIYNEEKHRLYNRLYNGVNDYTKGYLDGIINSQLKLYGGFILEEVINKDILKELQKSINISTNPDGVETPEYTYANYILSRRVTELERKEIITKLSNKHNVDLYTNDTKLVLGKAVNRGSVDYYNQMPYVFNNSAINLNITLKSIKSGIPLRVFDILGSNGFLISNFQSDMLEFFVPNEDFVYYESVEDLLTKVEHYLSHRNQAKEIAHNGYKKVKEFHNFHRRVDEILNVIYK